MDGRTQTYHEGQPCVASVLAFQNGDVCRPAREVALYEPEAAASCAEFGVEHLDFAGLSYEVQLISLSQAAARPMTQVVTLRAFNCPPGIDCMTTSAGYVRLIKAGSTSLSGGLQLTATSSQVTSAYAALLDETYIAVRATVAFRNLSLVEWHLQLTPAWGACTNQLELPLVNVRPQAKVDVEVTLTELATCLSGGVELELDDDADGSRAYLPWDSSERTATAIIGALVAPRPVVVQREGDGHATAAFRVSYTSPGDHTALKVRRSALQRVFRLNSTSPPSTEDRVILPANTWHLAPEGATECDFGELADDLECADATGELALAYGATSGRSLQTGSGGTCLGGSWGGVPLGCSVQTGGDWTAHFKTSGSNCNDGGYRLVCSSTGFGPATFTNDYSRCYDSTGAESTSSWYGTEAEARTRCAATAGCTILHDYDCDGQNWRFCASATRGSGPACGHVLLPANVSIANVSLSTWANATSASVQERIPGGIDLTPIPGRYLTAPSDTPTVSVRLNGQTSALCESVDWNQLRVGCFNVGDLGSFHPASVVSPSWSQHTSLERCTRECGGSQAVGVRRDECVCLSSEPSVSAQLPAYSCTEPCSGDASQLCGGVGNFTFSVYRAPTPTGDVCAFRFSSTETPQLSSASTTVGAENSTLALHGSGLLGTGPPIVSVCGGAPCAVISHTSTTVTCSMPICAANADEGVVLHVPPQGYADSTSPIIVRGVLHVSSMIVLGTNATGLPLTGSAAGGVLLELHGTGFSASSRASHRVSLVASGADVAQCTVLSSSSDVITCRTESATSPLVAAGTLCDVRLTMLSSAGQAVASHSLSGAFRMLDVGQSPLIESFTPTTSFAEGGVQVSTFLRCHLSCHGCGTLIRPLHPCQRLFANLVQVCVSGQRLDAIPSPSLQFGASPCTIEALSATAICCAVPRHAVGAIDVSLHYPSAGYALSVSGLPQFDLIDAPRVLSLSPTVGSVRPAHSLERAAVFLRTSSR